MSGRPREGPAFKELKILGLEAPEALRLAKASVLRAPEILGGSFVRILRAWEAPGGFLPLTTLCGQVGPLPKNLKPEASDAS